MIAAVRHMAAATGAPLTAILPMAFDTPHRMLTGHPNRIAPGTPARLLCLHGDSLTATLTGTDWEAA
jgi:N-acetylglucosamine-6-phosphate deacetylase